MHRMHRMHHVRKLGRQLDSRIGLARIGPSLHLDKQSKPRSALLAVYVLFSVPAAAHVPLLLAVCLPSSAAAPTFPSPSLSYPIAVAMLFFNFCCQLASASSVASILWSLLIVWGLRRGVFAVFEKVG